MRKECDINGVISPYDACSSDFQSAIKYYVDFDYIGSGKMIINGQEYDRYTYHFFKYKTLKTYRKSKLEKLEKLINSENDIS